MKQHVRPGVTTREIDEIGAEVMCKEGARSAPELAYGSASDGAGWRRVHRD